MNFMRKSTDGLSIGYFSLDFSGGVTNYAQMAVQSIDQGPPSSLPQPNNSCNSIVPLWLISFKIYSLLQIRGWTFTETWGRCCYLWYESKQRSEPLLLNDSSTYQAVDTRLSSAFAYTCWFVTLSDICVVWHSFHVSTFPALSFRQSADPSETQ